MAIDGASVAIQADTVCVHGDNPNAVPIIQRLVADCREAGIRFQSLAK
jgi:lactam utilization protein B